MITRAPTPRFQSGGRQSRIDILVREAVGWRTDELNRAGNIVPMKQRSTAHRRARGAHPRAPGDIAAELPVAVPREYTEPLRSTGTVDDDDEPEDEHEGENEAAERASSDRTEAPEEFERDDEDRP